MQQNRTPLMRAIKAVGRFVVAVAAVAYLILDELLFPLFRPLIAWLTGLRLFQRLGEWLGRLPPYVALVAFAVPFIIIEPVKVAAIWWVGIGHVITGTIGLLFAHALSLLVVERIFHAAYEPLMRIGWFAKLLGWLFGIRDRAIAMVTATSAWRTTVRWARGVRGWLRDVIAQLR
ncbi:MAG: hypothetical protein J0I99_07350 [Devosia sp.]|uniref:hypothetical protein n=1 Tax=Devosia sp. TaxID=1871048 RepID=UPI001AD2DCA8|nr:hypothetical protein [Devosia sp.]MBN9309732.1 hypothetical protein [Devosia sp.]MBN9315534.1 hypothetical protein [Devosia sp.]